MRIQKPLYSRGTALVPEDQCIWTPHQGQKVIGVADGVSGLYLPDVGPVKFGRWSGGRMAAVTLQSVAREHHVQEVKGYSGLHDPVREILEKANRKILEIQNNHGIPESPEFRAGTTFALAFLNTEDKYVEIAQVGDAMAVWQTQDGDIHGTPNQVFTHDMEMRGEIARLMKKYAENRGKMWEEFGPFLAAKRRERVNNLTGQEWDYGLLNGDSLVFFHLSRHDIPMKDLRVLLLFTDGFVPYQFTGYSTARKLRELIINLYKKGGLGEVLAYTRKIEEGEKAESHVDHAEATAVAIEF